MKMNKRKNLQIWVSCLLLGSCLITSIQAVSQNQEKIPPNVIIVLVDDLGYADVGFNGCKDIPTPNIDRIANEGVKFTNGYVSYAVCGPSRAGLITGRYQGRFGFRRNPLFTPNDPEMGLPLSEETLASALKKVDYKTIAIGKWHLGAHHTLHPLKRGFDDFYGFLSGGHRYFPEEWTLADEYEARSQFDGYRTKLLRNHERVEETEYLTDALSREAVNYIEKYQNEPFFMYLAYNAPHTPLQATPKYLERFDHIENKRRKTYAAMVSAVDDGVGAILEKLAELDLKENTMIWFLSDNGGPEPKNSSDNGALRGKKGDVFEGGIRVPFAVSWPAALPKGKVYEQPIISLDIFATAIENAGKPIRTKNKIDGKNLQPFINGDKETQPHDWLFWYKFDQDIFALRQGNMKLINYQKQGEMLFDLTEDISETKNVKEDYPQAHDKLQTQFQQIKTEMKPPIFMGLMHNDEYDKLHPNRWSRPK